MNFENLSWPKPMNDADPENAAELLERQRADEIFARQEEEEMEKTAELVAEQEKKSKVVPKKIYHSHPEKKYRTGRRKLDDRAQVPAKKEETPGPSPEAEDRDDDNVRHPYDEIYPYNRNLRR